MSRPTPEDMAHINRFLIDWTLELAAVAPHSDDDPLEILDYRLPGTIGYLPGYDDWAAWLLKELRVQTTRWLETRRREEEESWRAPTANDGITIAFAEMRSAGIIALEHAGLTIEDGWAHVGLAMRGGVARGALFFHQQDVLDALEGRSMALAFGAFDRDPDAHDRNAAAVASEAVGALRRQGIEVDWSGSPRDRIELAVFPWRKRRFTSAPTAHVTESAQLAFPGMFRSKPVHTSWPADAAVARESCVQPVYAKYDTFAFDAELSARLRGAWTLYTGGRGQAHHHGLPHTFVRAGEITTLWPGPALENLAPADARVWWERGCSIKASPPC
jgi:hypothetical protein